MYDCKATSLWTIKKAEHRSLLCSKGGVGEESWVPGTTRSNQSILKKINPEYSLEGLMLKFQYFGHLMWRTDSLEKTLMLGKIEGKEKGTIEDKMVGWHHRLDGHESEQAPARSWWEAWRAAVHGVPESRTPLSDWTTKRPLQIHFPPGTWYDQAYI